MSALTAIVVYALAGMALMTIAAVFDNASEDELRRAMLIGLFVGVPWALMILVFAALVLLDRRRALLQRERQP
jgi:NADH:ubiquinone oxidoreductase subunit 6 (subunit J)